LAQASLLSPLLTEYLFAFTMKAFVAYVACASGHTQCLDPDAEVLLQLEMRGRAAHQRSAKGAKLLQTVDQLVKVVNERQDPDSCQLTSDATRAAVDEELPAIIDQHTHFVNEVNDAADAVENCGKAESYGLGVLEAQKTQLEEFRDAHQTCRMTEHEFQEGLKPCQQYKDLRISIGSSKCVPLPNDEDGWIVAVQNHQSEMNTALDQAKPLQEACHKARGDLAAVQPKCALAQARFESGYCGHRASCTSLQQCRSKSEELYGKLAKEIREALETLHSEYQVLKHVECLLDKADEALNQGTIINADSVTVCSELASIDHLMIDFPEFGELETCAPTIISQPPCAGAFFDAEYKHLPQHEAIEAACVECTVAFLGDFLGAELTNGAVGELLNPDFEIGSEQAINDAKADPTNKKKMQQAKGGYLYVKELDSWKATGNIVIVETHNRPWGNVSASSGQYLLSLQRSGTSVAQSVEFEQGNCYMLTVNAAQRPNSPVATDKHGKLLRPRNARLRVSVGKVILSDFHPENLAMLPHTMEFTAKSKNMLIVLENTISADSDSDSSDFLSEPKDQSVLIDNLALVKIGEGACDQ